MTEADDEPRQDTAQARLLGHPLRFGRRDLSDAVGVSNLAARRFWQALGLPRVGDDEVLFTDADLAALERVVSLVREGHLDEPTTLAMTRAMARSAAHLGGSLAQIVAEMLQTDPAQTGHEGEAHDVGPTQTGPAHTGHEGEAAELLLGLADELEPLVVYAWRRHLAVAVAQLAAQADEATPDSETIRTVGFADMVGFTRIVSRLTEQELRRLVERFEGIASDTIASYGGHLVKTIGDGVLFSARDPRDTAGIALTLIDSLTVDPEAPSLRVGLAMGPVLMRQGDLYGTPVNLAARLLDVARPGSVVVDERVAAHLGADDSVVVRSLWPRTLRGFGMTRMSVIRAGSGGAPAPSRARR
ncbi:MAG: adenylate/guanylate cyclase domain-containing protein [Dermatophilaceae bacterium]